MFNHGLLKRCGIVVPHPPRIVRMQYVTRMPIGGRQRPHERCHPSFPSNLAKSFPCNAPPSRPIRYARGHAHIRTDSSENNKCTSNDPSCDPGDTRVTYASRSLGFLCALPLQPFRRGSFRRQLLQSQPFCLGAFCLHLFLLFCLLSPRLFCSQTLPFRPLGFNRSFSPASLYTASSAVNHSFSERSASFCSAAKCSCSILYRSCLSNVSSSYASLAASCSNLSASNLSPSSLSISSLSHSSLSDSARSAAPRPPPSPAPIAPPTLFLPPSPVHPKFLAFFSFFRLNSLRFQMILLPGLILLLMLFLVNDSLRAARYSWTCSLFSLRPHPSHPLR